MAYNGSPLGKVGLFSDIILALFFLGAVSGILYPPTLIHV
jgi:hypothetical protein